MKRPQEIALEELAMSTIVGLTSAFESLASMKISQTKTQVLQSQAFFNELWHIYSQLRVDSLFRFGREKKDSVVDKDLFIAVTAEGGFSGDIDQRLISFMLKEYDPNKHDIIIIGHHGALQLAQLHIQYLKYYKLPEKDDINVQPLIQILRQYRSTVVFYQSYLSLTQQDIKRIELQTAVQAAGSLAGKNEEVISELTYIFEPSTYAVVAHLERSMIEIALSQVILDSKLAQYASRFRAMTAARERSTESVTELHILYNRTKRNIADERLKEILNGRRAGTAA
ncbi:MAG TPA: F0F1 ATP synthase subunit gamma [Candidatus Saccharimonadales bacterium]|nr:F0F1 ATP synthase subunit gamma [Candidatus Saccharimonadales bacterium]